MAIERIQFEEQQSPVYTDLVIVDNKLMYFSGLISSNLGNGELIKGDIAGETRQVLNNLRELLERYGSDMEHLVRLEVLLSDFSERDAMNAEYVRHFKPENMPARLCYGNVGLAAGCKIEIMAIAERV
ncbi:RidA family protein [Bacillota bacterium]